MTQSGVLSDTTWIFALDLATSWALVGLIWIVQAVHYPLFAYADRARFREFHEAHSRLITWVVAPLMIGQLGSGALLLRTRPDFLSEWAAWVGFGCTTVAWASTFALQVPQHRILTRGFDARALRWLLRTNWIRTVVWSVQAGVLLWAALRWIDRP